MYLFNVSLFTHVISCSLLTHLQVRLNIGCIPFSVELGLRSMVDRRKFLAEVKNVTNRKLSSLWSLKVQVRFHPVRSREFNFTWLILSLLLDFRHVGKCIDWMDRPMSGLHIPVHLTSYT